MRLYTNKKGQMRIIETILAAFIIMIALSSFSFFNLIPLTPKYEVADLERTGYSVLQDFDQHGLLAWYVYNQNWNEFRTALKITLPVNVYFNVIVRDIYSNRVDNGLVSYGEASIFENAKNLVSISYALVGHASGDYEAKYVPRIVILQLVEE